MAIAERALVNTGDESLVYIAPVEIDDLPGVKPELAWMEIERVTDHSGLQSGVTEAIVDGKWRITTWLGKPE